MTRLANEMDLEPDSFLRALVSVYRRGLTVSELVGSDGLC